MALAAAETVHAYILIAGGWLKLVLLVIDKESLEIRCLAKRSRIHRHWELIDPQQYDYVLRE